MQRAISILLLFLYLAAWLRPYYPYVDYAMNTAYFANVLCEQQDKPELGCNGKCHLDKKLKQASKKEFDTVEISYSPKVEILEPLFTFQLENIQKYLLKQSDKEPKIFIASFFSPILLDIPSPPPKVTHA
jgi:hypothetical protein